jgi:hypothetical protein
VLRTKYIFIFLTFTATIAQGIWVEWLQDEGLLIVDIPLVLLYILGRKKIRQSPYAIPALVMITIFFIWSHIGMFFAPNQVMFRQETMTNIRAMLIFLSIILFINSKDELQGVFLGFAIGVSFQGLVAIHQWLRGPVGLGFLGEKNVGWQAQGTFVHPSILGMYLSLLTILMYRVAVYLKPKFHGLYVAAFFIGVTGLYASLNRATWIGFAASMTIMFIIDLFRGRALNKNAQKMLLIVTVIGIAGGLRYGGVIIARFNDSEESMNAKRSSSRKSLALDAVRIMNDHPVTGVGLNNYRMYVDPETLGLRIVHCSYLLIGAELGYPGLVIFVLVIISFGGVGVHVMFSKDKYLSHISSALVTAMISFSVAILPSPDYRILYVKNHIWMIWGLALVAAKLDYYIKKQGKVQNRVNPEKKKPIEKEKVQVNTFAKYVPVQPNFGPQEN